MKTKIITVASTIVAVGIAGTIGFISTAGSPAEGVTTSTCMPTSACGVEYQPTTTSTTSVKRHVIKSQASPKRSVRTTTTTSEVPPRLTAEQEASIPPAGEIDPSVPSTDAEIEWCLNTHQDLTTCKFPESEGMGEDEGTDFDLPNS